jgi:hypothetical protein
LYYTVTEGRARALDRLNLRDRATHGLDWIVLEATNARDAVRQWRLFKLGPIRVRANWKLKRPGIEPRPRATRRRGRRRRRPLDCGRLMRCGPWTRAVRNSVRNRPIWRRLARR